MPQKQWLQELVQHGRRAEKTFRKRFDKLEPLSKNTSSRLAVSINAEISAHLNATIATYIELHKELSQWVSTAKIEELEPLDLHSTKVKGLKALAQQTDKIHQKTNEILWGFAVGALETCVKVAEVNETKELLELAEVIASKTAALFGSEYVKLIFETISAIREGKSAWSIRSREFRNAGKVLAALELFMMSSLAANQYAVARVHSLTRPRSDLALKISREELARIEMGDAKKFVATKVIQARNGIEVWLRFPKDGFWDDAPTFDPRDWVKVESSVVRDAQS
jgi:hypothetical protein